MKKILAFALFCSIVLPTLGQNTDQKAFEPVLKYGKPSMEELNMTQYSKDTTASAVVLYSITDAYYAIIAGEFKLIYEYQVKIKVLKPEGTSYANINIPYASSENSNTAKENIYQIEALSYNLEKGKMSRTKMEKDMIFKERMNKNQMQIKFSIPNVKVGTVFEYKYKLSSDYYYIINNWEAQQDIPVIYTKHEITIPEYFVFSLEMRGKERLTSKEDNKPLQFSVNVGGGKMEQINCNGRQLTFIGNDLPALKSENYVWCVDNYRSIVDFELKGVNFPFEPYKTFTKSWKEIDEMLMSDNSFGDNLKMRNPFKDEMVLLNLDKLSSIEEKVATICNFLKRKITWNEDYALYSPDIKKAIKNGTGSNADINFVLMSMLRDANIKCNPVVMTQKTSGILPLTHPSIQKLNTFVVGIANTDSTMVYLDGSAANGYINILPPSLMVDRGRLINQDKSDIWLDMSNIGKNKIRGVVNATIDANGMIAGKRMAGYQGQYAAGIRKSYHAAKDSTDFIRSIESNENIKIKNYETRGINEFSPEVKETFSFEKQATVNDSLIYINPMVFTHVSKNPFIEAERTHPIELPYKEDYLLSVSLQIPEGYKVEELPKPMSIKTEDGQGFCKYNITSNGRLISINYTFGINKLLYLPNEYKSIKVFWEAIAEKNNEMLVIKKI